MPSLNIISNSIYLSIYTPWPFPPVWGIANNTKETKIYSGHKKYFNYITSYKVTNMEQITL